MRTETVKEQITIGKENFDIIYRSGITGNLGTFEDLRKGRWDSDKPLALVDRGQITIKHLTIVALRLRTKKEERLIIDPVGFQKERCPRCFYASVTELSNGRMQIGKGPNWPVLSSKVDFGGNRVTRRRETSKYCECCDTVYVKEKVVTARY